MPRPHPLTRKYRKGNRIPRPTKVNDFTLIPGDSKYYKLIPGKADQYRLIPGSSLDFELIPTDETHFTLVPARSQPFSSYYYDALKRVLSRHREQIAQLVKFQRRMQKVMELWLS